MVQAIILRLPKAELRVCAGAIPNGNQTNFEAQAKISDPCFAGPDMTVKKQ